MSTNSIGNFLSQNKVLLFGLLSAIALSAEQYLKSGPIDYRVMVLAILVAAIGFLANNLHGQWATILGSLLPTLGILFTDVKDHTPISWFQIISSAAMAIGAVFAPDVKPASSLKAVLILVLIGLGGLKKTSAQSPFKPEHKVVFKSSPFAHAAVSQPDSFYNAWRFTANVSAYNYTFGGTPTSSSLSGMEYGYERQRWNKTNGSWDVLWSINAAWFPINTAQPITLANIQTFGVTFGFKNPIPVGNSVIQIGPDFNLHAPKNQQWGLLATIGILLN